MPDPAVEAAWERIVTAGLSSPLPDYTALKAELAHVIADAERRGREWSAGVVESLAVVLSNPTAIHYCNHLIEAIRRGPQAPNEGG